MEERDIERRTGECTHESGILNKVRTMDRTLEYIVCLRCSATIENTGEYERRNQAIVKVYERDGYFKEYKLYIRRRGEGRR